AAVGLARPSVYRYVSSQHDLLVQLLIQSTQEWNAELEAKIADAPPEPPQRIRAYVDATLDLFATVPTARWWPRRRISRRPSPTRRCSARTPVSRRSPRTSAPAWPRWILPY